MAAALFASLCFAPAPASAQADLPHLEDATVVPRGTFRLRAITAWTRFDARFTDTGVEPLGAAFTAESLGVARLPALRTNEQAIAGAAGSSFSLSLGRSRLDARGREEVVPIGLEYGVTNRLSVGVMVPIVRRRVAVQFRLDSAGANVGPNLQRTSPVARQANAQVQLEFANAAAQLQSRLQFCRANPGSAGCAALLAREAEATQLIAASQSFATDVENLYGSASSDGMAFVPVASGSAQAAVQARVADFNARYRDLLGTSTNLLNAMPVGAGGPAGSADLQEYLTTEAGRDSLTTEERSGIGDVEIGVKALVVDRPAAQRGDLAVQLALGAAARLPTGSRDSPSELADLTLGGGAPAVSGRAALDVKRGRFGALLVGDALVVTEGSDSTRRSTVVGMHVAPRWHVSGPMAFHLAYTYRSADAGTGALQLVGGGVSISTLARYRAAGGPPPFEMRFTHLEAIDGPPGTPKFFREQIEFRLYYRLFPR